MRVHACARVSVYIDIYMLYETHDIYPTFCFLINVLVLGLILL